VTWPAWKKSRTSSTRAEAPKRSAEYLALKPMGKVPALVDGETVRVGIRTPSTVRRRADPQRVCCRRRPRARGSRAALFQAGHVTPACFQIFRSTHARMQEFWASRVTKPHARRARASSRASYPVLEVVLQKQTWLEGSCRWPTSPTCRTCGSSARRGSTSRRIRRCAPGSTVSWPARVEGHGRGDLYLDWAHAQSCQSSPAGRPRLGMWSVFIRGRWWASGGE